VLNEARAMGVEVLPPDVNEGQALFAPANLGQASCLPVPGPSVPRESTVSGPAPGARPAGMPGQAAGEGARPAKPAIRFGLAAIKGVGELAVQAILEARLEGGQ